MKKILKYGLLIFGVFTLQSCVKDMQDELNDGGWNQERSVLGLTLKNQIGDAEITRIDDSTGEITVTLNVAAIPDLSKVEIEKLELSYQGIASANKGDVLDFSNPDRTAVLSVTSPTGKTREYTIYATEFIESIVGTWNINNFVLYGGTGPMYGGGRVYSFMDKSWCWYDDNSPEKEYDNVLTFTLEEVTEEGNTKGKCINNAGADGRYADFIYKGSSNPETKTDVDMKHYYRQIPEGESQWIRDYARGTITFIDKDGKQSTGVLESAGTYDMGYDLSVTVPNNAFSFSINGVDDWTYIYSDYDVFVKKARKFYVMVTKQN